MNGGEYIRRKIWKNHFIHCLQRVCKRQAMFNTLSDLLTYGIEREKRELYKFNRDDILQIQKHLDKLAAEERSVKRKAI